jgi:hypothetical protein
LAPGALDQHHQMTIAAIQDALIVHSTRTRLVLGEMRFDRSPVRLAQPELESLFEKKSKSAGTPQAARR